MILLYLIDEALFYKYGRLNWNRSVVCWQKDLTHICCKVDGSIRLCGHHLYLNNSTCFKVKLLIYIYDKNNKTNYDTFALGENYNQ